MPAHTTYLEPYSGFFSVGLQKPPCLREFANDIDAGLIEMWRVLRDRPESLGGLLAGLPYTSGTFDWAANPGGDVVTLAAKYLVRSRFSRGGLRETFAWSERLRGKRSPGGPIPGDAHGWDTIRAELPLIAARVQDVGFRCGPALDAIAELDGPGTLVYVDSPYLLSTRTAKRVYRHEMTPSGSESEDRLRHAALLAMLRECRGMVMISGYPSDLYDRMLADWNRHTFNLPNHAGQGLTKQRRTEVVWCNF